MRRRLAGAALGALLLCAPPVAQGCGEALRSITDRVANERYEVVFAASPSPIPAGKFFALDIAVCPRSGAEPPTAVRVDATMPEHRHGMNYKPVVVARGADTWHADGLMFHMPGRWDIAFALVTSAGTERLTATTQLE